MARVVRFRRLKWGAPPVLRGPVPSRRHRARPGRVWPAIVVFAFVLSAAVAGLLFRGEILVAVGTATPGVERTAASPPAQTTAFFTLCHSARGPDCVIDGDTFRHRGTTIRIADIDAPEVRGFGCTAEKALGDRATDRLLALLNSGPFALAPADRDEDRYGRKLRVVMRDGVSLGMVLVAEGLARPWDGARRPWC